MSDKSREELEERVEELENTVQKMLPSRRQAMKGMATAAGAGMLGFSAGNASAQASTEDGDGNVGDPDDRVDVFGDGGDFNVVSAVELNNAVVARSESKLSNALDNGREVVIPTGTTIEIESQLTPAGGSHLHIKKGAALKQADGADINNQLIRPTGNDVSVTFRGEIDANGQNQSASESAIVNAYGGSIAEKLVVDGLGEGVIKNAQGTRPLNINGVDSTTFANFEVRGWIPNGEGDRFIGAQDDFAVPEGLEIDNVRFRGDTFGGTAGHGDCIKAGIEDMVVRNCYFYEVPRRCTLTSGKFVNNRAIRPASPGGGGDVIAGNPTLVAANYMVGTADDTGDNAVIIENASNVDIVDNYIRDFSGHGIGIAGPSDGAEGIIVKGNTLINNNHNPSNQSVRGEIGIDGDVTGFLIEGNLCRGSFDGASETPNGILIESPPTEGRITDNVVTGHATEINDTSSASVTVESNVTY